MIMKNVITVCGSLIIISYGVQFAQTNKQIWQTGVFWRMMLQGEIGQLSYSVILYH